MKKVIYCSSCELITFHENDKCLVCETQKLKIELITINPSSNFPPMNNDNKLKQFRNEIERYITSRTQELGLHNYYEIKQVILKALDSLEMIW